MDTVITGLYLSSSASRDAVIAALRAASAVFLPARLLPRQHCHRWKTCMKLDLIWFCMLNHMQENCSSSHLQPFSEHHVALPEHSCLQKPAVNDLRAHFPQGLALHRAIRGKKTEMKDLGLVFFVQKSEKKKVHFLWFWQISLSYNK